MSNSLQRLRALALQHWTVLAGLGALFAFLSGLLLFRLNTLLPGYSPTEVAAYHAADSLKAIWNHPLNAPYEVLVHIMQYVAPHNLVAVRLASTLVAWIAMLVFTVLVLRWHGWRAALMAAVLFTESGWFLHTARLGSPQVVFLGLILLVGCGVWLREKQAGAAVTLALLLSAIMLYTPGMVWFLGIGLLLQWSTIDHAFKKHPGSVTLGGTLFLLVLAPLVWHLYKYPADMQPWLSLPDSWSNPLHMIRTIIDVPLTIFFRAPADSPETWLGRLPVLSVFGSAMALAGAYVYAKYPRLARVRMLVLLALLGSVVIGLSGGHIPITPLVPFAYLLVAAGMGYLIEVWYAVFPRNPIARSLGATIIGVTIALAGAYNMTAYFIAWPQASATQEVFTVKKP